MDNPPLGGESETQILEIWRGDRSINPDQAQSVAMLQLNPKPLAQNPKAVYNVPSCD